MWLVLKLKKTECKKMKETTKITRNPENLNSNFYPCLVHGIAKNEVVRSTNFDCWNAIGWKIVGTKEDNIIEMITVFYADKVADARAFFHLDTETGRISKFLFENMVSFHQSDIFNANTARNHSQKSGDAFKYVVRLIHYFNRVNSIEEEKNTIVKTGERKMATEHFGVRIQQPESTYDPNREKVVYTKKGVVEKHQKNFTKASWSRVGHYRNYKNGKKIYIKPTECSRHAQTDHT